MIKRAGIIIALALLATIVTGCGHINDVYDMPPTSSLTLPTSLPTTTTTWTADGYEIVCQGITYYTTSYQQETDDEIIFTAWWTPQYSNSNNGVTYIFNTGPMILGGTFSIQRVTLPSGTLFKNN